MTSRPEKLNCHPPKRRIILRVGMLAGFPRPHVPAANRPAAPYKSLWQKALRRTACVPGGSLGRCNYGPALDLQPKALRH